MIKILKKVPIKPRQNRSFNVRGDIYNKGNKMYKQNKIPSLRTAARILEQYLKKEQFEFKDALKINNALEYIRAKHQELKSESQDSE